MSAVRGFFNQIGRRIGLVGLGAITLIVGLVITLIFYLGFWQNWTRPKGEKVVIEFKTSAQLQPGDLVRVAGREVGRVNKIESLPGGRGARVTTDVRPAAGPIYDDARADLRWRLLLGGAFYLDLDPGTPGHPKLGGRTIPIARTSQQVELDDVTRIFRPDARKGMQTLPGELSTALSDPQPLTSVVDSLAAGATTVHDGLRAARGVPEDEDLTRLVAGTAATVRSLDAPQDDLRTLVSGVGATVETVARRNADLRAALDAGPRTMSEIDLTLGRLEPTLTGADGLVSRLQRSAGQVAPTLANLRPTLVDTNVLLNRARPLLRALNPALGRLGEASDSGVPVVDGLVPSLRRLDDTVLPYLAKKDPGTGKSTTVMIGGTAAGFGGSAGALDPNGHLIRFPATGGDTTVYLPCKTQFVDPSQQQLAACDSLQDALRNYLKYLPGAPQDGTPGKPGTR